MSEKELFYTAEGLRRVAEIIQEATERGGVTQKWLADEAGIAASTITKVLLNAYNHDGRIAGWIRPSILIKLAPLLTNPQTGERFTPSELLTLASRFELREKHEKEVSASNKSIEVQQAARSLPYPKSVAEIRKRLGKRKLETFAKSINLPVERLKEILTSTDPQVALPDWAEVLKIAGGLYEDRRCDPLIQLYASEAKTSNAKGFGSQPPRSLEPGGVQTFPSSR